MTPSFVGVVIGSRGFIVFMQFQILEKITKKTSLLFASISWCIWTVSTVFLLFDLFF